MAALARLPLGQVDGWEGTSLRGKRHDLKGTLESHGFMQASVHGTTTYGGTYIRNGQQLKIELKRGFGDLVSELGGRVVIAECKGGVINSTHAGRVSRLRKGLCEAVGLLMTRSQTMSAISQSSLRPLQQKNIARRMLTRAQIALIEECGAVNFIS